MRRVRGLSQKLVRKNNGKKRREKQSIITVPARCHKEKTKEDIKGRNKKKKIKEREGQKKLRKRKCVCCKYVRTLAGKIS